MENNRPHLSAGAVANFLSRVENEAAENGLPWRGTCLKESLDRLLGTPALILSNSDKQDDIAILLSYIDSRIDELYADLGYLLAGKSVFTDKLYALAPKNQEANTSDKQNN